MNDTNKGKKTPKLETNDNKDDVNKDKTKIYPENTHYIALRELLENFIAYTFISRLQKYPNEIIFKIAPNYIKIVKFIN